MHFQNEMGRSSEQGKLFLRKIQPFSEIVSYVGLNKLFNFSPPAKVEKIQLPSLYCYLENQLMSEVCLANLECSSIS